MLGWTPELQALTSMVEAIRDEHATLIAANSKDGKRKTPTPLPRPRTAVQRVRRRRDATAAQGVIDAFSPKPA